MDFKFTAPCHFGLEKTLSYEIKKAGGNELEVTDGRVHFKGSENTMALANISCSVAERIGIVLAEFLALSFDDVYDAVKNIRIFDFAKIDDRFPVVKGQSINSKLSSIPALQRTVKKALAESMSRHYKTVRLSETGDLFPVRFFLIKDKMTVFLDTSGEGLHKRGYRTNSGEAPIKETLAAGLCDLARVNCDTTMVDPFCGSGTLLIESAFKALNIPPCLNRQFAAEKWDFFPKRTWSDARERLKEKIIRDSEFKAFGFDKNESMVSLTLENTKKALFPEFSKLLKAEKREISDFKYDISWKNVKVITNPPYAERLLNQNQAAKVYGEMGNTLFPRDGHEIYVINSNPEFEDYLGYKAERNRKLYNGMLMCRFLMYYNRH
ncbi:MAG: class I SAM-dependent RNA methyltransferase [Eubacterium sp.]|jgi:putative N6-adenine-specific DNA methylase|nr:class I SAM-dependent RNA methyltransferase [Eubacterium sp.]